MNTLDNVVHLKGPVWAIDDQTAQLVKQCQEKKLPASYSLWQGRDRDWGLILETKDGQGETGDIISRAKARAGESLSRVIIVDVIIDDFFATASNDDKLNQWRHANEPGVKNVKQEKDVRTRELMRYKSITEFNELVIRRREALRQITEDPFAGAVDCFLGTSQFEYAVKAVTLYKGGSRKILADLCARFGKTIWSAVIAKLLDVDVIIVSAYVKTVFASFASDLIKYKQFLDFVHIDAGKDGYEEKIKKAIKAGKKVIVYVSLCPGRNRNDKIKFLGELKCSKFWIVDEADYGAHRPKQVKPLKEAVKNDYLLVMTGTNADRAINSWDETFDLIGITYLELLTQKQETKKELENA